MVCQDEYGTVIINGLANEIDENPGIRPLQESKTNGRLDNTSPTYIYAYSANYILLIQIISKKYYITEMDLHFVKRMPTMNHFVTYDHTHYVLIGNHLDGPTRAYWYYARLNTTRLAYKRIFS